MEDVNNSVETRTRLLVALAAILLAAAIVACLFSMLLPTSASLLAPTYTLSPTRTLTPTVTSTGTITSTPLSISILDPFSTTPMPNSGLSSLSPALGSPYVVQAAFSMQVRRDLWHAEVGPVRMEGFDVHGTGPAVLEFPYTTGNNLILQGQGPAQIIEDATLLTAGNLLLFRDSGQGLTVRFPGDTAVRAFGFDYTASDDEQWLLSFNEHVVPLPPGNQQFVGFVLYQDFPSQFRLSCRNLAQHGLAIDNITYAP